MAKTAGLARTEDRALPVLCCPMCLTGPTVLSKASSTIKMIFRCSRMSTGKRNGRETGKTQLRRGGLAMAEMEAESRQISHQSNRSLGTLARGRLDRRAKIKRVELRALRFRRI